MALKHTLVKFARHSTPYAAGEIAGFPAERAALYVKHGIAHYCDADGAASAKPVVVTVEPPSVRALAGAAAFSKIEALERLTALRDKKALSSEQFEAEKAKVLA